MKYLISIFVLNLALAFPAAAQCICLKCLLMQHKSFQVVSSAMAPAIDTGECGVATFIDGSKAKLERGMAVAYTSEKNDKVTMTFRIIGIAGDDIQMIDGVPHLNGEQVKQVPLDEYTFLAPEGGSRPRCREIVEKGEPCLADRFLETLPNGKSYEVLNIASSVGDNTPVYSVPVGHVFVLGDNRDNASDSRYRKPNGQGFIPIGQVFGIFEDL